MLGLCLIQSVLLVLFLREGVVEGSKWRGLSFDKPNFLCYNYEPVCENFLDEIGCSLEEADRINVGCPGFPETPNNITHFKGVCTCLQPVHYEASGAQVTRELLGNRFDELCIGMVDGLVMLFAVE
jgi:hypothetical protein